MSSNNNNFENNQSDDEDDQPQIPYRRDRTPSIVVQSLGLSFNKSSNITESIELNDNDDDVEESSQNSNSSAEGANTKSSTSGIDESPKMTSDDSRNVTKSSSGNLASPTRIASSTVQKPTRPLPGQNRRLSLNITSSMPRRQSLTVEGSSFINPNFAAGKDLGATNNATGSLRNKVALKPGHSLMGWIHMASVVKDLSGTGGKLIEVTQEELARHNKEDDCWVALKGNVYNVTLYLQYHPGGVEELMRGAGSDATELFNEAHRWVNYETMLAKCLVGPYKLESPLTPVGRANFVNMSATIDEETKSAAVTGNKAPVKPTFKDPTIAQKPPRRQSIALTVPSANKYQSLLLNNQSSNLNVNQIQHSPTYVIMQDKSSIRIRIQDLLQTLPVIRSRHLICDLNDKMELHLSIILSLNWLYRIHLRLNQLVKQDNTTATITQTDNCEGSITVQLNKLEQSIWNKIGTSLDLNDSLCEMTLADKFFRPCQLLSKKQLTHDTYLFEFKLHSTLMYIPIGWHVLMREHISSNKSEEKDRFEDYRVNKNYTPVLSSLSADNINNAGLEDESGFMESLFFIIKIYSGGVVTSKLNRLKTGDMIEISDYQMVDFDIEKQTLQPKHWFLFAAGTGITPFIRIISYLLSKQNTTHDDEEEENDVSASNTVKSITLIFFNKTQKDIIWRDQFDELASKYKNGFKVIHVLSNEPSWTGKKGRICQSLVEELIDSHNPDEIQMLSCGPRAFTQLTKSIANELNLLEKLYTFHG